MREAILEAVEALADAEGQALLKDVVESVQARLGDHDRFPNGRLTNYVRYTKTDLEARGELRRVPGRSPQRVCRVRE